MTFNPSSIRELFQARGAAMLQGALEIPKSNAQKPQDRGFRILDIG